VVQQSLANIGGVSPSAITLSVNGQQQSALMRRFHSLLQTESSSSLDSYVLVDFEIAVEGIEAARRLQSAIVASMSDILTGFRYHLVSTHMFPNNVDFTLLFIEIHGPNGMLVDECIDDEDADDDEDEASLEGRIGKLAADGSKGVVVVDQVKVVDGKIAPESMSLSNCTETPVKVAKDRSTDALIPKTMNSTWPAMGLMPNNKTFMDVPGRDVIEPKVDCPDPVKELFPEAVTVIVPPTTKVVHTAEKELFPKAVTVIIPPSTTLAHMNLPGRDGREAPIPTAALQIEKALVAEETKPAKKLLTEDLLLSTEVRATPRERRFIDSGSETATATPSRSQRISDMTGATQMSQLELRLKSMENMKKATLREVASASTSQMDVGSSEMPEATDAAAPAGGFPVPDNDDGAL
jgi:hypothetical protein